jgi:3alpha(or 20beta)-hydroxysteroid dehydrogenase
MTEEFLRPVQAAIDAGRIIPIGRAGVPDDIAGLALFLLSDASTYLSGATIVADGAAHAEQDWTNAVEVAALTT